MAKKTVDMEICEDDILYYIEDQFGNEIGFALEEDGVEHEYFYAKKPKEKSVVDKALDGDALVSREMVSSVAKDLNKLHSENKETIDTFKEATGAIKDGLEFLRDPFGLKTPPKPRPEEALKPAAPAAAAAAAASTPGTVNNTVYVVMPGADLPSDISSAVQSACAASSAAATAPAEPAQQGAQIVIEEE